MCALRSALAAATLFVVWPSEPCAADDVTANNPLDAPFFSIDRESVEVQGGLLLPGDVLLPTDPNMPTVEIPAVNLSLFDPNDDVDALSFANFGVSTEQTYVLIFSVDRNAVGLVPPDPLLVALGYPFNVLDQASKQQAAGDAFMSLLLYDRFGPIPPPTRSQSSNNTLVVNQGDAGGVDFAVHPTQSSPSDPNSPSPPASNANAASGTQAPQLLPLRDESRQPSWILFSLASGSPSLSTLPGNGSPADIYADFSTGAPGGEELYVGPLVLGLTLADDIDGLIVFDDGDQMFTSGSDQVIFSLAPGSPSLNGDFGPAHLFSSEGFGMFTLYSAPDDLGLELTDNLDLLDYVPCDHVLTCVYNWAIGNLPKCPGDINGDGVVDLSDLGTLLPAYGHCEGDYEYYPGADLYGNDGCVNISDLGELLTVYGTNCP